MNSIHTRVVLQPRSSIHRSGISLIEVLIIVAIIAVLATLLLPQASKLTRSGQRAQCASNLRQLGAALNSYLGDNNMLLPTSWVGLPCNPRILNPGEYMALTGHLAPYLGVEAPRLTKPFISVAQCPAFPKKINAETAEAEPFFSTYRLVMGRGAAPNPFGGAENARRISALAINDLYGRPSSKLPIIFNLDKESHYQADTSSLGTDFPDRSVFETGRNVLFLDGHVSFEPDLEFLSGLR